MVADHEPTVGDRIVAGTERYVTRVEECVGLLPELLARYAEGEPYRETAERVRTLESECDHANRQVSAKLTNATVAEVGVWNSRVHLNSPQVVGLYQALDEVANAAEQVADELVTVTPPTDGLSDRFREMAEHATEAMTALREAVIAFVRALCDPSGSATVVDEVAAVREAESTCDRLRNDAVSAAFRDAPTAEALLYREFALLLDRVPDAIEDVTDRVVLISSNESWVRTQTDDPTPSE